MPYPRGVYTPYIETPTDWNTMKLSNSQKRNAVYFVIFGLTGLALDKAKKYAMKKADEMYPDEDEKSQDD